MVQQCTACNNVEAKTNVKCNSVFTSNFLKDCLSNANAFSTTTRPLQIFLLKRASTMVKCLYWWCGTLAPWAMSTMDSQHCQAHIEKIHWNWQWLSIEHSAALAGTMWNVWASMRCWLSPTCQRTNPSHIDRIDNFTEHDGYDTATNGKHFVAPQQTCTITQFEKTVYQTMTKMVRWCFVFLHWMHQRQHRPLSHAELLHPTFIITFMKKESTKSFYWFEFNPKIQIIFH